ncbi:MAG: hypothetical protein ACYTFA_15235 [Planctomycetota bacterium]|jgi:hypothetical protein
MPPDSDESPAIEDGYTPETLSEEPVAEDDLDLLDPSTRSLDAAGADSEEDTAEVAPPSAAVIETDEAGDADRISEEPDTDAKPTQPIVDGRLDHDAVAHRIAVQLKRVEAEVREVLEGRDSKRKRKLSGTRRWRELEEDIIAWRYSGRFDEASLTRLRDLVARRHYLFRSLRYVTGTRRRWNT